MSLLTMVQRAARIVGVSANLPVVVASNDPTALQFLDLANEEGRSLLGRHAWQFLVAGKFITTTATGDQVGSIPTDFDRLIDGTMYNRTTRRKIYGPLTPQEWQEIESLDTTNIDPAFRIWDNSIKLTPTPAAGETVSFEYITNRWIASENGTTRSSFAADDDVPLFNEDLMALGIEWRFKSRKGFEHSDTLREYERLLADRIMRDGGRRTISSDDRSGAGMHRWWSRRARHDVRVIP